jgi:hypothetical protein
VNRELPIDLVGIAALLDVSRDTPRKWHDRGVLPAPAGRLGKSSYWFPSDVLSWASETGRLPSTRKTRAVVSSEPLQLVEPAPVVEP